MLKKTVAFLLALVAAFSIWPIALAESFDPEDISTPYVILMDASSGAVLYEKNARERAFPASTTKIMTCILALENCPDLDVMVTVGENVENKGSTMGIVRREELSLRSLIYGMMLVSGNDAAKAIAEYISGSESAFAELMNQKAASLGMTGTHFVKSNGLHEDDHYSTAYDMAILTRYAMQNEEFCKIVATPYYEVPPTNKDSDGYQLGNSNKLLYTKPDEESFEYEYATGVKTGDTDQAGRCLVASAEKDGVKLIAVLFGDPQGSAGRNPRFTNSAKLFDWGFENYAALDASTLGLTTEFTFPITGAAETEITARADLSGAYITDTKDRIAAIQANIASISPQTALSRKLEAPIAEGEVIGTVAYQYESATILSVDLIATQSVSIAATDILTDPSASPLITGIEGSSPDGEKDGGSSLVFWIILVVVLLLLVVVAKVIASRRRRRRIARRRRAYRARNMRR